MNKDWMDRWMDLEGIDEWQYDDNFDIIIRQ